MLITFEMISENLNISYKVFGKKEGNVLTFPDKSNPNTIMSVAIKEDYVEIRRSGKVTMRQGFKLESREIGFYQNDMGLEFEIASFTTEMNIKENMIEVFYEYYLESKWQSSNKLKIIF
mgnify:CR=1 FL=1